MESLMFFVPHKLWLCLQCLCCGYSSSDDASIQLSDRAHYRWRSETPLVSDAALRCDDMHGEGFPLSLHALLVCTPLIITVPVSSFKASLLIEKVWAFAFRRPALAILSAKNNGRSFFTTRHPRRERVPVQPGGGLFDACIHE